MSLWGWVGVAAAEGVVASRGGSLECDMRLAVAQELK